MSDSAFPRPTWMNLDMSDRSAGTINGTSGLTKRELFAAMAMQAMMSIGDAFPRAGDFLLVAQVSIKYADTLLAELAKGES